MILARYLAPVPGLARIGHHRVARDVAEHFGELQSVAVRQEELEDLRSADHGHWLVPGKGQGLFHAVGHFGSVRRPFAVARQDDVPSPGKQAGQTVERAPAHDHYAAHGEPLEPLQIGGDAPREGAVAADHAVGRPRDD